MSKLFGELTNTGDILIPGFKSLTRSDNADNTKSGLNVVPLPEVGSEQAQILANQALKMMLDGTLPSTNYNSFSLVRTGTTYVYAFKYNDIIKFNITISDPAGAVSTSILAINNFLLEDDSGVILLEDDSYLLLEG